MGEQGRGIAAGRAGGTAEAGASAEREREEAGEFGVGVEGGVAGFGGGAA